MLIPKQRLYNDADEGDYHCVVKYSVYDTEECAYVVNNIFGIYDTKEECQKAIDFCSGFRLVSWGSLWRQ